MTSYASGDDTFVAKFSGVDGSQLWSKNFWSISEDMGYGVAVDHNNNVLITGYFMGSIDFTNSTTGTTSKLTSAGGDDIFMAKFSGATGAHLLSKRFGSPAGDRRPSPDDRPGRARGLHWRRPLRTSPSPHACRVPRTARRSKGVENVQVNIVVDRAHAAVGEHFVDRISIVRFFIKSVAGRLRRSCCLPIKRPSAGQGQ